MRWLRYYTHMMDNSVRRILKRGGPGTSENLRRTKVGMNIVSLQCSTILRPKLGEDQKKGLLSKLVRFFA